MVPCATFSRNAQIDGIAHEQKGGTYAGFGTVAVVFFALRGPETGDRFLEDIERQLGVSVKDDAHA